jgi:hypothetical protein
MKKNPSKEQIDLIISRIDNLPEDNLAEAFLRLNPYLRGEFRNIPTGLTETEQLRNDMISFSLRDLVPPILNMLAYLKNYSKLMEKTFDKFFYHHPEPYKIDLMGIALDISSLKNMIDYLAMHIEASHVAIIKVDFNHSKELLLREFEKLISDELSKSPIHQARKKKRLQNEHKLRQYLKAWELRIIGLTFDKISTIINENESTVKKQVCRAFELIYDCKFSKDKFTELVIRRGNRKTCDYCPKKEKGCQVPCEEVANDLKSLEKYQREELYGNQFIDNAKIEFNDFLIEDNMDIDNEIDQEY